MKKTKPQGPFIFSGISSSQGLKRFSKIESKKLDLKLLDHKSQVLLGNFNDLIKIYFTPQVEFNSVNMNKPKKKNIKFGAKIVKKWP